MSEQRYTVFINDGGGIDGYEGVSVADALACVHPSRTPIAWAPLWISDDPLHEWNDLLAESIAAGRTIKIIDGKYVARRVAVEEEKSEPYKELNDFLQQCWPLSDEKLKAKFSPFTNANTEKKRAPLTWATPKPFDPFREFEVVSSTPSQQKHKGLPSPDLAQSSAQVSPVHGSAALLVKG